MITPPKSPAEPVRGVPGPTFVASDAEFHPLREAAEAATAGVVERVRKRIAEIDRHVSDYPSWVGGTTAQHADDCRSLLDENAGLRAALEPFAKFRLDGFEGTMLEVVPSWPENPARRIEPIPKRAFEIARQALGSGNG